MITANQRHMLLAADRTRDIEVMSQVVADMLKTSNATQLEIELALRDGAAHSYLIAGERLSIVRGVTAMLGALADIGVTPEQNRDRLGITAGN